MSATAEMTNTSTASGYHVIPLDQLVESKTNPRKLFRGVEDLAASMQTSAGLIQPITVRPMGKQYEIVAGARRYRAARVAKWDSIPAIVKEMSDDDVCNAQLIENNHREDVTPMEQARSYENMIRRGHDVKAIASETGRPADYIAQRLQLAKLVKPGQDWIDEGVLPLDHAIQIARLQPDDQKACIAGIKNHMHYNGMPSSKNLREMIARDYTTDLHAAAFPKDAADLVDGIGPCNTCSKRSGYNRVLFADISPKSDTCTDRKCFESKKQAFVTLQISANPTAVKLSDSYGSRVKDVITKYQWDELDAKAAKKAGKKAVRGVVVDGDRAGQVITVQIDEQQTERSSGQSHSAEQKRKEHACRIESAAREAIFEEVLRAISGPPTMEIIRLAARRLFEGLEGMYQKVLLKRYDVQQPKNAGYDWSRKQGKQLVENMAPAQLHKFFVTVCFISRLKVHPYYDNAEQRRDLEALAAQLDVDFTAIRDRVRAEAKAKQKPRKK